MEDNKKDTLDVVVTKKEGKITQLVRLFDILVIGPSLIYVGVSGKVDNKWKVILIIIAVVTIAYNGYYFIQYNKEKK